MIELADLKKALKITDTDADRDAHLTALEAAAAAFVQRYTNRYFGAEEDVAFYLTGAGHERLWLPDDAKAGGTFTVQERARPGDDAVTITAADDDGFLTDRLSRLDQTRVAVLVRKRGHVWYDGYEYAVTITRGYSAGSEPDDIRQAVTGLVIHWFQHRSPVAATVGINTALVPLHVKLVLDGWRRPAWA